MLANLESNVKFQHFQLYSQIGNLSLKNAQKLGVLLCSLSLGQPFFGGRSPTENKAPTWVWYLGRIPYWINIYTRTKTTSNSQTGMLSIQQVVFDVKSVRLGKMDHVQTAMGMVKTLIPEFKKSALFYWIPFKRKSMVQLFNYSGWDDLWPWNIRLRKASRTAFFGAFLSLQRHFERIIQKEAKTDVANLWLLSWAIWSTNWIERPLKIENLSLCKYVFPKKLAINWMIQTLVPENFGDFLRASHAFAEGSLPFRAGENWG